jgi:hypothetical protein
VSCEGSNVRIAKRAYISHHYQYHKSYPHKFEVLGIAALANGLEALSGAILLNDSGNAHFFARSGHVTVLAQKRDSLI